MERGLAAGPDLIGFSSVHQLSGMKSLKLDKLYVDSGWHRKGVGRALVDAALRDAQARGFHVVELAVNRNNHSAIAAYGKMGFVIRETRIADIDGGFVMDDFIMAAPVANADPA